MKMKFFIPVILSGSICLNISHTAESEDSPDLQSTVGKSWIEQLMIAQETVDATLKAKFNEVVQQSVNFAWESALTDEEKQQLAQGRALVSQIMTFEASEQGQALQNMQQILSSLDEEFTKTVNECEKIGNYFKPRLSQDDPIVRHETYEKIVNDYASQADLILQNLQALMMMHKNLSLALIELQEAKKQSEDTEKDKPLLQMLMKIKGTLLMAQEYFEIDKK